MIELSTADTTAIGLERTVSYLRSARRMGDRTIATLVDLSGALLVRAGYAQNPRDVIEALDAAGQATDIETRNAAARYDAALALSELGLTAEAHRAWTAYLALDSTSAWASQARIYLDGAARIADPLLNTSLAIAGRRLDSLASSDPEQARAVGWDSLLTAWATATLARDAANQARDISQAEVLGRAIAASHGDESLAQAVHAIAPALPWAIGPAPPPRPDRFRIDAVLARELDDRLTSSYPGKHFLHHVLLQHGRLRCINYRRRYARPLPSFHTHLRSVADREFHTIRKWGRSHER